jgi:hypothetical protein
MIILSFPSLFQSPIFGTASDVVIAVLAILATFWAGIKFFVGPRLDIAIKEVVGPQIVQIPILVRAVEKLTDALERQIIDTQKLNITIESLDKRIDGVVNDVSRVAQRTSTLEGAMPSVEATTNAAAAVIAAANSATEVTAHAASVAVSTIQIAAQAAADLIASTAKTASDLVTSTAMAVQEEKSRKGF